MQSFLNMGILAFILAFCSCASDNKGTNDTPGNIVISTESLSFEASGGTATVNVEATGEWTCTSSDSWVSVTNKGTLDNKGTVTVTADANNSTEHRTATLSLRTSGAHKTLNITQKGKTPEPVDPTISVPEGYKLVWHDEFDGNELNTSDWTHEVQRPGWVNNELQHYVNGSFNGTRVTSVNNGVLDITAFKSGSEVYSGRIYAKVNEGWTYGIFEARIRLPKGKGTWPAFWMMPVNNDFSANPWPRCGEIDIMEEVGCNPNYTSSSIHCESYNHVNNTQKTAERLTNGAQDDFHIYRLEWTKDHIITSVDGNTLLTFNNDGKGNVSTWPFNKPFYVILNLAWGGNWGGMNGVDESCLPTTMSVDYVRVFQPK